MEGMKLANESNLKKARFEDIVVWTPIEDSSGAQLFLREGGSLEVEGVAVIVRGASISVTSEYKIDLEGHCWKRILKVEHSK